MKSIIDTWRTFRAARRSDPLSVEEYFKKLQDKGLNPDGTQILDPVPMAPPIGYKKHPSMVEIVRDMVRSEKLAQEAAASGRETFEESEDFDVPDEPALMPSPWTNDFDPPLEEILAAGREAMALKAAAVASGESGGGGGTPPSGSAPKRAGPKPEAPTRASEPDIPDEP